MNEIPWEEIGRPALLVLGIGVAIVILWMRSQGLAQRCPSCGERQRFRRSNCSGCGAPLR